MKVVTAKDFAKAFDVSESDIVDKLMDEVAELKTQMAELKALRAD